MIRTIIIDDEEHARNRLKYMLSQEQGLQVTEVCRNGIEAIEAIESIKPDLIFLDIEMPELNGFDVLTNLSGSSMPMVIFVTAFSEYAVKAFEVNALDYIHKPFDKERLSLALDKVRERIKSSSEDIVTERLEKFLLERAQGESEPSRFVLKSGGSIYIVQSKDILWVEASGNYVHIVTEKKKHLHRTTLSGILKRLNRTKFFQIHRSTIVNLDYVDHIEEWSYGDYKVVMKNGGELKMSRNYKELIQNI
ncbi:MAG: DNA-binding response regulator [Balneola sp.]|nr:MAG: DNA-binding response regulator [Balneola sp.]